MSNWETDQHKPSAENMEAIARLLDRSSRELLYGVPDNRGTEMVARDTYATVDTSVPISHQLRRMVHDFEGEAHRTGATVEDMDYLRASLDDESIRMLLGDAAVDRPLSAEEQIAEMEIRFDELRAWLKRRIEIRNRGARSRR